MVRFALILALLFSMLPCAEGQWTLQQSSTTADLRGIDNVGNGIAWASGTNGTILRTTDSGLHWQRCTTPPNATNLDFRGIQAFDATTAIAMSSGPGDLSRLYTTTNACQSWTLLFTNPDKTGFFDAIQLPALSPSHGRKRLVLLGDPVKGHFIIWEIRPFAAPEKIARPLNTLPRSHPGQAVFAASNSSLFVYDGNFGLFNPLGGFWFGTGGPLGARVFTTYTAASGGYESSKVPIGDGKDSSGVFSLGFVTFICPRTSKPCFIRKNVVAVGGDYELPDDGHASAAFSSNRTGRWHAAITQPHGYRSAVAYDRSTRTWITVGPNGTDISTDDGRNWHPLTPSKDDSPDDDRNWNALSLPYVVGPHGRIGKLNPKALGP